MSRFTASPFHKPAPFEFPRIPFSPPETQADTNALTQMPSSLSVVGGAGHIELEAISGLPSTTDSPGGSKFRRGPSIAYHHSGLRESREKTVQRSSKSFIVVIPPVSFTQERGQLGHTLASGPAHRLTQGILMPLFPTVI